MSESDVNRQKQKSRIDIRLASIARVKNGESPAIVAKFFGVHRVTIYRWLSNFEKTGIDGLIGKRSPGKDPLLRPSMLTWIYGVVAQSRPMKFGLDQTVWTLDLIRILIGKEFHLTLSRRSVGRFLERIGLDIKRPSNGIFLSRSAEIQTWVHAEFQKIRAFAKQERAEIIFVERVQLKAVSETIEKQRAFVAITLRGHLYFQGASIRKEADSLLGFLTDLDTTYQGRKCIVLFDPSTLPESSVSHPHLVKKERWVFQVPFLGLCHMN